MKKMMIFALLGAITGCTGPNVHVKKITYKGWEESIELRNDTVRVVVVPAIGRIMHYGYLDGENLIYTNPEMYGKKLEVGEVYMKDGKAANAKFGGDRIFTTSDDEFVAIRGRRDLPDQWTDGSPYTFSLEDDAVTITSPVSEWLGIQISRRVSLEPHGTSVRIDQNMVKRQPAKTAAMDDIPLTLWNLTQIPPPKYLWQPIATNSVFKDGICIPNWSLKRLAGSYVIQDGMVRLTPQNRNGQKIGTDARGWIASWTDDVIFVQRFDYIEGETYPDGGTSTAAYSNPTFAELECLSPTRCLAVGETIEHTIWWELYSAENEQAATSILKGFN